MLRIHANVFAMPGEAERGAPLLLRGVEVTPLGGPPALTEHLEPSFEEVQRRLLELPRSDCEPDGFFLVTGHEPADDGRAVFWRLNGHMHEHAGRMHRVELHGECPAADLDNVLRTLGWPATRLAFQLVQEGVTLGEEDFREWANAELAPGLPPAQRAGASPPPVPPTDSTA